MGLARRDRGARRRRCGTSATTSNDELARNPHAPFGFRRRAGICGVAAPQQCAALPASRRLASPGAALGTRPMLLLGQAPRTKRLLLASLLSTCALVGGAAQVADKTSYRPELAVSETLEPFLKQLEPGTDAFPLEHQAQELDARLRELSDALRGGGAWAAAVANSLLDPGFHGARLRPIEDPPSGQAALEVNRAQDLPREVRLDARAFGTELRRLVHDVRAVALAAFLITAIEPDVSRQSVTAATADGAADPPSRLHTTIRHDIVGAGTK